MGYFPFFINITNRKGLIVGGGAVALRKANTLLSFDAHITVVSPSFCDEFEQLESENENLVRIHRTFKKEDLSGVYFAIAATNKPNVNKQVSDFCGKKGILVNVADSFEDSSFIFPSTVTRGNLVAGISSSGCSPDLTKKVNKEIDSILPDWYEHLAITLNQYRSFVKNSGICIEKRSSVFQEIFEVALNNQGTIDLNSVKQIILKYK